MIDFLKRYKITLTVIVIVIFAFVSYKNYYVDIKNQELLLSLGEQSQGSIAGQEILKLLSELQSIKFNTSIFSNDSFNKLIDFGQKINPEVVGRNNPFSPLGVDGIFSTKIAVPVETDDSILEFFDKETESEVQ